MNNLNNSLLNYLKVCLIFLVIIIPEMSYANWVTEVKGINYWVPSNYSRAEIESYTKSFELETNCEVPGTIYFNGLNNIKVTKIQDNAFSYHPRLRTVTIPNNVSEIGDAAFMGCGKIYKVALSDNLSRINKYVFSKCASLRHIHLDKYKCSSIEEAAFKNSGITELRIGDNVSSIGKASFENCPLTIMTIDGGKFFPDTKLIIEENAFSGSCPRIITCGKMSPPEIADNAFTDYSGTLFVKKEALSLYKSHPVWGKFAIIREFPAIPERIYIL